MLALVFMGGLLASGGSITAGASTPRPLSVSVEPKTRAGQPPVSAGRAPTLGPQSFHPSRSNGVQLDVFNALRNGSPIFNGDFADPFALKTATALYLFASDTSASRYAPAAHIPEIELTQSSAFQGYYVGDALPRLPKWTVSGYQWAPSVWARPDGTYVMYYSTPATHPLDCVANPSARGCVRTAKARRAQCASPPPRAQAPPVPTSTSRLLRSSVPPVKAGPSIRASS